MKTNRLSSLFIAAVMAPTIALPAVFYVSTNGASASPFDAWENAATNLHDAVDLAGPGDSVHAGSGVYVLTNTLLIDKPIHLLGVDGPEVTTINQRGANYGLDISHTGAIVEGFTLRNLTGDVAYAGAVLRNGILRRCHVYGHIDFIWVDQFVAPIYSKGMQYGLVIEGGVAEECRVTKAGKRGVWMSGGTLTNSHIFGNNGRTDGNPNRVIDGGGIYCQGGEVTGSYIYSNTLNNGYGGGIYLAGTGVVRHCIIERNWSGTTHDSRATPYPLGIAVYCADEGVVESSVIRRNQVYFYDGQSKASVVMTDTSRIYNCEIYSNWDIPGYYYEFVNTGVIVADQAMVQNCTIVNNDGLVFSSGGTIRNSIVISNYFNIANIAGNLSNFAYCITEPMPDGPGNSTAYPSFANEHTNDYRLAAGSPGIDSGSAAFAPDHDIEGNLRPIDGDGNGIPGFDIGAHEYATNVITDGTPPSFTVSPEPINGCTDVTVTYAPNDGPLTNSTSIMAIITYNWRGFTDPANVNAPYDRGLNFPAAPLAMTFNADATNWTVTFGIHYGMTNISILFSNDLGRVDARRWNEGPQTNILTDGWVYPVNDCINPAFPISSSLEISPDPITGCADVTATYTPNNGPLATSSNLFAVVTYNQGLNFPAAPLAMTYNAALTNWSVLLDIQYGMTNISILFSNNLGQVDGVPWYEVTTNAGGGWAYPVNDCINPAFPISSSLEISPDPITGCADVTATYTPYDGPLAASSNLFAVVTYNQGLNFPAAPLAMTYNAALTNWSVLLDIQYGMTSISIQFSNNLGQVDGVPWYEVTTNAGGGWAYPVIGCTNPIYPDPSTLVVSPDPITGCREVTATYTPREGPLANSAEIQAIIKYHGGLVHPESPQPLMYHVGGTNWTFTFNTLINETNVTIVLSNDLGIVDASLGNGGWSFPVTGCVPPPPCRTGHDYNGDFVTDLTVYNPASGQWYIQNPVNNSVIAWALSHGYPGVQPLAGDFNGDGKDDPAVYDPRNGRWYIRTLGGTPILWGAQWGFPGGIVVVGDFDNDKVDDLVIYNPATHRWYARSVAGTVLLWNANRGYYPDSIPMALNVDTNMPDRAVFYFPKERNFQYSSTDLSGWPRRTVHPAPAGLNLKTIPVILDLDGNGIDEPAVFATAPGYQAWLLQSSPGTVQWGFAGSTPLTGDYDGDRRSDFCVYHEGRWYIRSSTGTVLKWNHPWGAPGFIPVK